MKCPHCNGKRVGCAWCDGWRSLPDTAVTMPGHDFDAARLAEHVSTQAAFLRWMPRLAASESGRPLDPEQAEAWAAVRRSVAELAAAVPEALRRR